MEVRSDVAINNHPIYTNPKFRTEREILLNLTQICGLDTSIWVIDYYPDAPTVEIGIIDESAEREGKMPFFKDNTKIVIHMTWLQLADRNPIDLPQDITFPALQKIVLPITANFENVMNFLVNHYEWNFKESCVRWFEAFFQKKFEIQSKMPIIE